MPHVPAVPLHVYSSAESETLQEPLVDFRPERHEVFDAEVQVRLKKEVLLGTQTSFGIRLDRARSDKFTLMDCPLTSE